MGLNGIYVVLLLTLLHLLYCDDWDLASSLKRKIIHQSDADAFAATLSTFDIPDDVDVLSELSSLKILHDKSNSKFTDGIQAKNAFHVDDFQDVEDATYSLRRAHIDRLTLNKILATHDSWTNCGEPDDILNLRNLTILPDPPVRGDPLTIAFEGDLKEPIDGSEVVNVQVKYGVIKIVDLTTNLCEELRKVSDTPQCPFQPGHWQFNHTEVLPADIPPGRYSLTIDAYSKKFKRGIFCISGTFRFDPSIFNWWTS